MLIFKPAFLLSSFTLIKRLFSSSSLSAIKVVSSAYLRLLVFLLAILILACESSSLAFHLMYSVYRGFPGGTSGKEPACQYWTHRDASSVPGSEGAPGRGHGNPLQYSCLENPMGRGDWWATLHRVA